MPATAADLTAAIAAKLAAKTPQAVHAGIAQFFADNVQLGPVGPIGPQGIQGIQGLTGNTGPQGTPGVNAGVNLDGGIPTSAYGGINPIDGGGV